MLIKDKYRPLYFDDYKIHTKIIHKLKNIIDNLPNLVIYGPHGTGKTTIAHCILNELFKKEIISTDKIFKIKVNNVNREFTIQSSNYHFEINLNKYNPLKNKIYFIPLIKLLVNNNEINSECNFRLIIIKNIEYVADCQRFIKNIIEKNDNLKLICITNTVNKIWTFRTLFTFIRIPIPSKNEIGIILDSINNKNNETFLKKNNSSNLSVVLLKYEIYKKNKNYKDPIDYYIKNLLGYILNFNIKNVDKCRILLYEVLSKNIDFDDFLKKLYFKIIAQPYNRDKKINITNIFIKYTNRISISFKNIVHIEALVIELMKLFCK